MSKHSDCSNNGNSMVVIEMDSFTMDDLKNCLIKDLKKVEEGKTQHHVKELIDEYEHKMHPNLIELKH